MAENGGNELQRPQWDADEYRGPDGQARYQALLDAYNAKIATQNSAPTLEQFKQSVTPGQLDASGRFNAPTAGVNYAFEGLTPQEAYNQTIQRYQTAQDNQNSSEYSYGKGNTGPSLASELNPAWRPGVVSTANGLLGNWGAPLGMLAAAFTGGAALAGAGGAGTAAAGAAAATPATGLAGTLGMNAGLGATALNTGAFNTGMSLLRGQNLTDSLKNGLVGAALSPVGTMAGNAAGSALSDYGLTPTQLNAIKTIASNTAIGGAQGALTGRGVGQGLQTGLVNGLVNAAGNYVGSEAKQVTGSNAAGTAANTLTQASLRGGVNQNTINALAQQYASGQLTSLTGLDPQVANLVVQAANGRKLSPVGALTQVANGVGSSALRSATMGRGVGGS